MMQIGESCDQRDKSMALIFHSHSLSPVHKSVPLVAEGFSIIFDAGLVANARDPGSLFLNLVFIPSADTFNHRKGNA